MEKSKLKCPKCRSNNLHINELWTNYIGFTQEDGEIDRQSGNLNESNPYKLEATCAKCCHKWTVKNATQITDVCGGENVNTDKSKCVIQRVSNAKRTVSDCYDPNNDFCRLPGYCAECKDRTY